MLTLIRQELYKMFMRKKTYVVLIGFILLTVLLAYGLKSSADNMKIYNTPEYQIQNIQENIDWMEQQKNEIPENIKNNQKEIETYQENLQMQINESKQAIESLKDAQNKNLSWQDKLKNDIASQKQLIEENKSTASSDSMATWNMDLEKLQYLQDKNIQPMTDYDFNAYDFISKLIEQLGQIFLAIGIAVFAADIISGEWTPPTLKLLLSQPVSRGKILLSKFISTVLASVVLILVVEIIAFFLIGLVFGFGNGDYPAFTSMKYTIDTATILEDGSHPLALIDGSWSLIPMWQYTIKLLLTQSIYIIAITSFVFMISSLVKSSMVSMAVSVVSLIAGMIVFQFPGLSKLSKYIFVNYYSIDGIVSGRMAFMFNDISVTGIFSIIVMAIWIILCYVIAHFSFTKRDLLI